MTTKPWMIGLVWLTIGSPACTADDGNGDGSHGDGPHDGSGTADDGGTTTSTASATGAHEAEGGGSGGGSATGSADTSTSTTGAATDDGATTGPVDDCIGLDEDACFAQQMLGNCQTLYGTPYLDQGGWCLFANGLEYLGCRALADCPRGDATTCSARTGAPWALTHLCDPPGYEACEPPCVDCPAC